MKSKGKKVKGKAKGNISELARKYADKPTKGNLKNSGIKFGVELLALLAGGALSAGLGGFGKGYVSIGAGLVSIGAGNYFGDPTKLSSILGASMVGYGIGRINEHKALSENTSLQGLDGAKSKLGEGFSRFASELKSVLGIKPKEETATDSGGNADESVGSIDTSILDQFDDLNRIEAIKFDEEQQRRADFENELKDNLYNSSAIENPVEGIDDEEFSYGEFDDVDISTF